VRAALQKALPFLFLAVFAATRWPGLLPSNFSLAYALMFCAGVFFPGRLAWGAPLGVMLATDLALNAYYQFARGYDVFTPGLLLFLGANYAGYAVLIALGRRFRPAAALWALVAGGVLGAFVFYVLTNTVAWWLNPFRNPEYVKTLAGWLTALTKGTAGYAETWTFFRHTLLSGALFTALFAGTWKLTAGESPREKGEEPEPVAAEPEEAQA
jgi:hypothetical protein